MVVGVFRGQILLWQGLPPVGLLQPDQHHLYNSSWTVDSLSPRFGQSCSLGSRPANTNSYDFNQSEAGDQLNDRHFQRRGIFKSLDLWIFAHLISAPVTSSPTVAWKRNETLLIGRLLINHQNN